MNIATESQRTRDRETLLQVEQLKKYFPVRAGLLRRVVNQVRAVDGISLQIAAGKTVGLVGESGCGKSTLGRAILQLQKPTAGKVFLAGREITGMPRAKLKACRSDMQIIFQDPYASLSRVAATGIKSLSTRIFRRSASAYRYCEGTCAATKIHCCR